MKVESVMSNDGLAAGRFSRPAPAAPMQPAVESAAAATAEIVVAGDSAARDACDALAPAVEALGYELVHAEFSAPGRARVLRLYIDAPGGIRVDDCEAVSRHLNESPAAAGALAQAQHLEVSSPGLDRPLVRPEHFRRFTGHRARIIKRAHAPGPRRLTGQLLAADARGIALEVDGERHELAYADLAAARLAPANPFKPPQPKPI